MNDKPWDARAAAWLVRPFIDSPSVMPNHFTLLRLVVGLGGAFAFASGTSPNAAAWLIVLSNFLDHTDGELARLGDKGSRFGHYFDLVSDAIVTIMMFVGIGLGLARTMTDSTPVVMGSVAGAAVALIFQLRHRIEARHGKVATRQARWGGFEAEDILYLLPLVTYYGGLSWFLHAAAVGAPIGAVIVIAQYLKIMHNTAPTPP
jgi:archaetidylinositol phosphate synthase